MTVFYSFTRDLKNLLLKVLSYHYLTSEPIALDSSCSVTPCLFNGLTESARTAILCLPQTSYGYFSCGPQASGSPWVTAGKSRCHFNYELTSIEVN